jgi:quercetin dioxygenase-like cupin family protein
MEASRIARSLIAAAFVVSTVLTAAACADDRPAGAGVQAAAATTAQPSGGDHVMVDPAELKWADAPSLPLGAKVALIEGQLDQPVPFTLRVQFPAGYQLAAHRHPAIEHTTVLSGVVNMGVGDTLDKARTTAMPAGSITIMQAGTNHFLWTEEGATVQVHGVGPFGITYVDPADDPRTK